MSINLKRFNRINRKKIFNKLERVDKGAVPAIPKRPPLLHPQYDIESLTDIFLSKFSASAASFQSIDSLTLVPELVLQYAEQHASDMNVVTNISEVLQKNEPSLLWPEPLTLHHGPANGEQSIGLSYADVGIAETGSIVLISSKKNPTSVNFLPDHHIVILNELDIVPNIEMMWKKLSLVAGSMPRAINIITGPSRTADIEQTIQLGAHGPRSLHILLLMEPA
ncbi:hypothetical protein A9Q99_04525 [Gammaproteobacteria bacterium 45_16_T64]|nr:hypothetical protein A9Q99_04525 [Gammaproteobacteria bacterium 45_16_T64]